MPVRSAAAQGQCDRGVVGTFKTRGRGSALAKEDKCKPNNTIQNCIVDSYIILPGLYLCSFARADTETLASEVPASPPSHAVFIRVSNPPIG